MKTRLSMRVCSAVITLCMLISLFPVSALGAQPVAVDVSSPAELEAAINKGDNVIRVIADFELDRTFYITGDVTIYSDSAHTLTRSADFGGDIFIIGEDKNGQSALIEKAAALTLGRADSDTPDLLTFDGNKAGMSADVYGSFMFICNSSAVSVYEGVTFKNARKVSNQKTLDERYDLSYPNRIGGAVAIVASGVLDIYGGTFADNQVNNENTDELADESERDSSLGGAIFNYSNVKIYGGKFVNNGAARGGAVYNYRTLRLEGALFEQNYAFNHGGAIYQAGSQYAQTVIGSQQKQGDSVLFSGNTAASNGGAMYTYAKSSVVCYGDVTFSSNTAGASGGAVCSYGVLLLQNASFDKNSAVKRGGAVYTSNSSEELTTRLSEYTDCVFTNNSAPSGAALALFAGSSSMKNGAKATVTGCSFESNSASGNDDGYYGGAVYVSRKSELEINGSVFKDNTTLGEAGALYISENSKVSVTDSQFISNTAPDKEGNGGAISVRSSKLLISGTDFDKNSTGKNGAALYISYKGELANDSEVTVTDSSFNENTAANYGAAIYATRHVAKTDTPLLTVYNTGFNKNGGKRGGAVYLTSGTDAYMNGVSFEGNTAVENGGGIFTSESELEIDGAQFTANTAVENGGGIEFYKSSTGVINNVTADSNQAGVAAGFLYNSGSDVTLYNSTLKNNSSEDKGGALSLHSKGITKVYATLFDGNSASGNGGAMYVYTGESETVIQASDFKNNLSDNYGGAVYVSNESLLKMYDNTASANEAKTGGVIYATTGGTEVTVNGITLSGNKAKSGPIIYGNSTKTVLNINKTNYKDLDTTELTSDYWSEALKNKLKLNEIEDAVPDYSKYVPKEIKKDPVIWKDPVSVEDVFSLANKSSSGVIDGYEDLARLDNSSNFMSRSTTAFDGINGKTVTVDSFAYHSGKPANNPSVGLGILIYQTLLYKKAHPEKQVYIDVSAFRFSVEAAVCINRDSRYFGYMRNLVGKDYDEYGFVRISYLLITAAKMGINVNIIGQLDGYPISASGPNLSQYFTNQLSDPCDPDYASGVVGDYMDFNLCRWTSSSNIDGINANGTNGNNGLQTGTIISGHEAIYRVSANYLRLVARYCGQEEVYLFRDLANKRATEQIELILAGKGADIAKDEQIVYLGSETDDVFELYFAPFGSDRAVWDETYNPYCKYLRKLQRSEDSIIFTWNNANYKTNFALGAQMEDILTSAFCDNKNKDNKIYLNLSGFDTSALDALEAGRDIGFKSFNKKELGAVHSKDLQLSYVEDGQRYNVTLLNSLNVHGGSMSYQSNFVIVIKEKRASLDSVFYNVLNLTTKGMATQMADTSMLFEDVYDKWYKAAVDYCYSYGLMSGTSEYTFGIDVQMTRAQFVQVLANLSGAKLDNNVSSGFSDVPSKQWYTAAVKWAKDNGIVSGIGSNMFAPNAKVDRQQMCVMLVNYVENYKNTSLEKTREYKAFADDSGIAAWSRTAVIKCYEAGIVSGAADGKFMPRSIATRQEAAAIFSSFHRSYIA